MLRRQFLKISGLVLFLTGCGASSSTDYAGDGGGTPVAGGDCNANGAVSVVGGNHGHSAPTVPNADVVAGVQQTYNLGMGSGHVHTVTISAANFTTLQGNTGVSIATDADATGHSHTITFNCA